MKEMVFCSHCDQNAAAVSTPKQTGLPKQIPSGSEAPYDKVLYKMRSQEMLFYSNTMRSGY